MTSTRQTRAFLDTLAWSEIGPTLLKFSDDGYNVLVGSTPDHPTLFVGYADHPRIHCAALDSDAAGRYQILSRIFDAYKVRLNLPDFGHASQDAIALQLIRECHAAEDIEHGRIVVALSKCRSRWASLPGAPYPGQPQRRLSDLVAAFKAAGGGVAT